MAQVPVEDIEREKAQLRRAIGIRLPEQKPLPADDVASPPGASEDQVAGGTVRLLREVVKKLKTGDIDPNAADAVREAEFQQKDLGLSQQQQEDAAAAVGEIEGTLPDTDPLTPQDAPAVPQGLATEADADATLGLSKLYQKYAVSGDTETGAPLNLSDFNEANLETTNDVFATIEAVSQNRAVQIDDAKRGEIRNQTTRQMADLLGMTPASLRMVLKRKRGDTFNAEQMLAARDLLVWSGNRLDQLAAKAGSATGTPEDKLAFRRHLALHQQIQAQVKGAQTEIARALQQFNIPAAGDRAKNIDDALFNSGADTDELLRLYNQLETPEQRNKFVRDIGFGRKTYNAMMEVWINLILSGPPTHVMNTLGNAIMLFDESINRTVASFMPRSSIQRGEGTAQAFALYMAFSDAIRASGKAWMDNKAPDNVGGSKIDFAPVRQNAFSAEAFEATGGVGKAIDLLGTVMTLGRFSSRTLEASDVFFKVMGDRMAMYQQAFSKTAAMPFDERVEAMTSLIADPTPGMQDVSQAFQKYVTLQTELGKAGKAIQTLARIPGMGFFLPFIKTPANSLKRGLERTPFALLSSNIRETISRGGPEADLVKARIATGSALMGVFTTMAVNGMITGGGPSDNNVRRAWREAGWQPYSIKIGDTYVSYARLEPYATFLGLAADMGEMGVDLAEAIENGDVSGEEVEDLVAMLTFSVAENVTNKSFLSGLGDLLDAVRRSESFGPRAFQNVASGFVPNMVAVSNRALLDDQLRYTRTTLDAIRAKIPGFSKDLPPTYDVFGEPRTYTQIGFGIDTLNPFYMSEEKMGLAYQLLRDYEVPVTKIPENVPGVPDEKLPPKTYAWLQWRAGQYARQGFEAVVTTEAWKVRSAEGRRLMLQKILQDARRYARDELMAHEKAGPLREMVIERKQQEFEEQFR